MHFILSNSLNILSGHAFGRKTFEGLNLLGIMPCFGMRVNERD